MKFKYVWTIITQNLKEVKESLSDKKVVEGSYSAVDKEQITHATIGNGTIIINGEEENPEGLNRDESKAQEIIKDINVDTVNAKYNLQAREWAVGELESIMSNHIKNGFINPVVALNETFDIINSKITPYKIIIEKDENGNIEKMMLYTNGRLTEESKKEPAITEIGYVHYVYNGYEDVQRIEYAPKEDEYMKIYHLKDGTKDIYHEKEEGTLYEKHNENGTIVERGQFDEESKQTGTWEYYDNSGKLTGKKEFQEGKEVKESSNEKKNLWVKPKNRSKEQENER